jgi:6-phosphogluconolactonase
MHPPKLKVFPDSQVLADEAARILVAAANDAIQLAGKASIVLSGGATPRGLYQVLASEHYRTQLNWASVHLFFADERTVPPDHPDSNFRLVSETLLEHLPIPYDQVHRMKGELDPQTAADEYDRLLQDYFHDAGPDLVLLGMGQDGHTASLFPGSAALAESGRLCVANFAPSMNTWRITLTASFINRAHQVMFLVSGSSKSAMVQQALEADPEIEALPVQLIHPEAGPALWLLDAAAAGMGE